MIISDKRYGRLEPSPKFRSSPRPVLISLCLGIETISDMADQEERTQELPRFETFRIE
jgi:hypothetical protein